MEVDTVDMTGVVETHLLDCLVGTMANTHKPGVHIQSSGATQSSKHVVKDLNIWVVKYLSSWVSKYLTSDVVK